MRCLPRDRLSWNGELGSGSSGSKEVELYDDDRDAIIEKSDIDPPAGYQLPQDVWIEKSIGGSSDGYPSDPTRSQLGF